jgi:hypothetical protein
MRQYLVLIICAIAGAVVVAAQTQQPQSSRVDAAPKANEVVTVTGCMAAGANNTFTLTAPAQEGRNNGEPVTGTTLTTPAGSKVTKTIEYTLVPASKDVELKAEVGHTVRVTGREAPPQVTTAATDQRAGAAGSQNAIGTSGSSSGSATPTVKTTTQTQIVVRQLTVSGVTKVADKCDLGK